MPNAGDWHRGGWTLSEPGMTDDVYTLTPIGRVRCGERYRFEAPRQGVFARNRGVIELAEHRNYEAAVADLAGFDRIWVLFIFHLNENWSVKVSPPVAPPGRRIGVFATRSPHRPNRLGLSCVELDGVKGRRLWIRNFDLLDNTPVVDLKPYIPAADAFPEAAAGWLAEAESERYEVDFSPEMQLKSRFIRERGGPDPINFCLVQLSGAPLDRSRKRLFKIGDDAWEIGCRTWRIEFSVNPVSRRVRVADVRSHFRPEELAPGAPDRYGDLELHRAFHTAFPGEEA